MYITLITQSTTVNNLYLLWLYDALWKLTPVPIKPSPELVCIDLNVFYSFGCAVDRDIYRVLLISMVHDVYLEIVII